MENTLLENIIVKSKVTEAEYPYSDGDFKVSIAYLTKDEVLTIKKDATKSKITKHSRIPEEIFDEELFTELFVGAIIKGWSGLTYGVLESMVPIADGSDLATEIAYSPANALILMRNCTDFDTWISEVANDLSAFTKGK